MKLMPDLKKKYDLMLLSNINQYANGDYFKMLEKEGIQHLNPNGIIQASYGWFYSEDDSLLNRHQLNPGKYQVISLTDRSLFNTKSGEQILILKNGK